jgi:hypothetical protein
MSLQDHIQRMADPEANRLSDAEFEAVRRYVSDVKDDLDVDTKAGLFKLLRVEEYRRAFGTGG